MAGSSYVLLVVLAAAVATASLTCPAPSGLFTSQVDFSCAEPFECMEDFCACVGGSIGSSCVPFSSEVSAATVGECTARRVTCTLNAALNARLAGNSSCRHWGEALVQQYTSLYNDHSNTNLTDACAADMCEVVTSGNSAIASSVNLTYACSLVNFSFPDPSGDALCAATKTNRSYFDQMPVQACPATQTCIQSFCTCLNGTFNAATADCKMPDAVPDVAVAKACVSTGLTCIVNSALSVYVPGASPFDSNECLSWSVGIAEDYVAYSAATTVTAKRATQLYKSCNHTACSMIFGNIGSTDFADVCDMPLTAESTFQPYNPCPFQCPDATCAAELPKCACVHNASLTALQALFVRTPSTTFDVSTDLNVAAFATYGVSSGPCSGFAFGPFVRYVWTLAKSDGTVVATVNSSTLVVPRMSLVGGQAYVLNVTARGLLPSHVRSLSWTFTGMIPAPQITITGGGGELRVGNTVNTTIRVAIVDLDTTAATAVWSCVAVTGTCPDLTDVTSARLLIRSGATAGSFDVTFTYRGQYTQTVRVTIVDGSVPVVRVVPTSTSLSTSMFAFLSSQTLQFGSAISYSSPNVTYLWTVNGVAQAATFNTTLSLPATNSAFQTTTLANIAVPDYTLNTVTLRVSSAADSTIFGEASMKFVVVEPVTVSLTVTSTNTPAVALTDTLTLTPSAGALTSTNAPFGAPLVYWFEYIDNISSRDIATGLPVSPSGSAFVATAPLHGFLVASKSLTFRMTAVLGNVRVGAATATFTVDRPSDMTAVANSQLASLSAVVDLSAAVQVLGNLRAVLSLGTNAAANSDIANTMIDRLANLTASSNISALSATQISSALSTLSTAMKLVATASKASQSAKVGSLVSAGLATFDPSNTDVFADTIDSLTVDDASRIAVAFAAAVAATLEQAGVQVDIEKPNFKLSAIRETAASLAGQIVSGSASRGGLALPANLNGLNLADLSIVIAIAVVTASKLAVASTAAPPAGSVVNVDFSANGAVLAVNGLEDELTITLPSDSDGAGCYYYNEAAGLWQNDGLRTVINPTTGRTECKSKHLTAFGGFTASSAATVALSVLAVLVAVVLQLVLA